MPFRMPGRRSLRELTGSPFQLLLLAASFALAGYAGVRLLAGETVQVALWFVGSALLHDLVLVPLYGMADRALARLLGACGRREWLAYVRVPALLSGLLLLVWFPLISGRVSERYAGATGLSADGFLARWLLVTAVLFAGSALLLLVRSWSRSRSRSRSRPRLRRATKVRPSASQ
ncbi:hypothetical protein [Streptomyces luteolus]|uniref:Lipoprotein n=1 Tax=Streptomyces luteolus TaxID=3043615 RepID=A0ABT6SUT5_9ACTN|nr:hypothetical protein [Streptomyces sp. B-S-A12]MDI3419374.1 hypothetical protein [Streptomyces sp. B-S-A12]